MPPVCGVSRLLGPTDRTSDGCAIRAAPPIAIAQPKMVMITGQFATQILWAFRIASGSY